MKYEKIITIEPITSPEAVKELRAEANKTLAPKVFYYAEKYSLPFNNLRFKNNTSNWGSCSNKRNLNLNIKLLQLPVHLQDYVILHELAHLKHLNHGQNFHKYLQSLLLNNIGKTETALRKELNLYRLKKNRQKTTQKTTKRSKGVLAFFLSLLT